ncbi:hypothetical protein BSLG_010324 [Batrachochytrium salamandrivorans]|nr:hypothetical protein BSLG_010324 [Batrachochytrium salamandrivorans]
MLGWVVRILGRLRSYNVHTNMAQVEYRGQQLLVDTALLGIFDYKINSLYQWIGELVVSTTDTGDCICLQAKILRNVDELDTALFEESLKLRRQIMG